MDNTKISTGYGPSNQWQNLIFDGDARHFEIWETKFLGYMKLKNLKDILIGSNEIDEDENEVAFAELVQFLDERSIALVIRDARDKGREAFKILKDHYAGTSKPRIITLYNQLTSLKKLINESITDYIIRAEKSATTLNTAGENVSDALLIAMVLKGLPDEYRAFVAIVTQSETSDNFQKFKQALRNFEETESTRTNQNEHSDNKIMKFKTSGGNIKKVLTCYTCGMVGHKSTECQTKTKTKMWCNYCKSNTHNDKSCRKQSKDKAKTVNNEQKHTYAFKINEEQFKDTQNKTFLVDCGATTHIVNNDDHFPYIDESFNPEEHYIELADGTKSNNTAKKRGTVETLLRTNNNELVTVTLENTLYIPTYPQCIFSVQAAAAKGARVNFNKYSAELISKEGTVFPIHQYGRLYYLYKSSLNETRAESLEMWHKILGHCNSNDIMKLECVAQGMKINNTTKFNCETYILSKNINTYNRQPDSRATYPFQLVHTDLAGPLEPVALDGFKYVINFVDDYSSCLFTYFLQQKSDAVKAAEKFLADIAPYGKVKTFSFYNDISPSGSVKCIRSDNGGEYLSKEFKELLLKHTIKHEFTSPYSPHQNGTAERNWRSLFDMARAMIIESKLPKHLWTYAVSTATYIRNRCYVQRIKCTPYGLVTGFKPNIARLHLFGSVCYPYVHNTKKLQPRSNKGYFVGYDKDSPSYLVNYPESNSVLKHRLVKFTEKYEFISQIDTKNTDGFIIEEPINTEPTLKPSTPNNEENKSQKINPSRYPSRQRQPPKYLEDYIVDNGNEDEINYIDYCYLMNIPTSYNNAINTDDSEKWKSAMEEEMQSLITNDTFVLTELPTNKKLVGGRWVYMIKSNSNGVMYKARYVAKGYKQIQGIDYLETFSPTARMESVRILMQISIQYDLILHQMDVKSAYLHAPIENEIYVSQPPGYEQTENNKQLVWKLNKSLYGLKQSGRNWQNVLSDFLKEIQFVQSNADACVFIKRDNNDIAMILVWVDDIIIAANSNQLLFEVKKKLSRRFKMKDLGPLTSFLGIQFNSTNNCVTMNQSDYLQNVLHKFGFFDCKPRSTPCEQVPNSYQDQESTESSDSDIKLYRQMVGSLLYAMTCTRPDLSYVVTILSQHLSKPNSADWTMINHVFRYIKYTLDYCLTFRKDDELKLYAYCDADWASSFEDRHSISGYCFSLSKNGPVISWKSRKQASIALSTCEAEYMAISAACQEMSYLSKLLKELLQINFEPVNLRNDNHGAIALVKNPIKHMKSKHIDIRYHFVREFYQQDRILLEYIPSNDNYADIFTKPAKKNLIQKFKEFLFGT